MSNSIATVTSESTPSATAPAEGQGDAAFFGHPRGLATLFFAELWERFSYYGMRAILLLFMITPLAAGGMGFPTGKAGLIYGTYTSLVYLMSLPGGWLADRFLGLRRAVLWGGVLILLGHVCLAFPSGGGFYAGLALVVMGTGLLKPNISALVGELYGPEDARRDAGFSIYYMGINLGAFLAPLAVGWLAQGETFRGLLARAGLDPASSWHYGFGAAAVGMAVGLLWYVAGGRHLGEAGLRPAAPENPRAAKRQKRLLLAGACLVLGGALLTGGLAGSGLVTFTAEGVGRAFGYLLAFIPLVLFPSLFLFGGFDAGEKKRLVVIMLLFFGAAVFWSVFEQAGSTLTLFADRDTESVVGRPLAVTLSLLLLVPAWLAFRWYRSLPVRSAAAAGFVLLVAASAAAAIAQLVSQAGRPFPSSFFQSANALFIVTLAPLFAALWVALGSRQPSSAGKFAAGLLFAGLGFAVLVGAAGLSAGGTKVSPMWLLAAYLLHTVGELCLSPVGLAAMSRLAPKRIMGLVLGIWFLAVALGNFLAGFAASFYETLPLPKLFLAITAVALLAALLMAFAIRPIRALLSGTAPR